MKKLQWELHIKSRESWFFLFNCHDIAGMNPLEKKIYKIYSIVKINDFPISNVILTKI